jgi:hypothetical protein
MRGPDLMRLLTPITRHRTGRDAVRRLITTHHAIWARKVDRATLDQLPLLARGARTASERSAWATAFATGPLRARRFALNVQQVLRDIDARIRLASRASSPLRTRLSAIQPS